MNRSTQTITLSPPGTPNKSKPYRFPLHSNIELDPPQDDDMITFFIQLLAKAIDDQRNNDKKKIFLKNGRLLDDGLGGLIAYEFEFDGKSVAIEDAEIILFAQGKSVSGTLMGAAKDTLLIQLSEKLSETIDSASITVDNTSLLRRLRGRYETIGEGDADGFNVPLANAALGLMSPQIGISSDFSVTGFEALNNNQKTAVKTGLGSNLLYLWGPPGTGKSATLSVLIRQLHQDGKRVLIASNTNFAIDGVFKSVVKALDRDGDVGLQEGHILRLGTPYDQELADNYLDLINPGLVVERKTEKLEKEKKKLQEKIDQFTEDKKGMQEIIDWFEVSRQLASEYSKAESHKEQARDESSSYKAVSYSAKAKVKEAKDSLQAWKDAGRIRRLVMEKRETLEAQVHMANSALIGIKEALEKKLEAYEQAKASSQEVSENIAKHDQTRPPLSQKSAEKRIDELEEDIKDLNGEIATIEDAIKEVFNEVMAACQILAATVHQVYMRPKLMEGYDVVVVDEASMIQLPALYHCCGMATEKAIIAGDFRQLPPIAGTQEEALWKWTGRDVFDQAGVVEAVNNDQPYPGLVLLNEQYRMDDKICQCISKVFYSGKLETGEGRQSSTHPAPPEFISDRLLIIDTSSASPYCQKAAGGSKYNLLHAAASLEIVRKLDRSGYLTGKGSIGICTPFASQKNLTRELVQGDGYDDLVTVGTVHTYQGDEKELMILDIIDGDPQQSVGVWSGHDELTDDGAKLFNVAVSRAKEYLIVLANVEYLEKKLPSKSILRGILHDIQDRGQVVDVLDLLDINLNATSPLISGEKGFDDAGWYTEDNFFEACRADIENATTSIVIFSGFVTGKRVDDWIDLLSKKIQTRVSVKCITRPPRDNRNTKQAREALHRLRSIGAVIDIQKNAHQKVVMVDGVTLWLGSLNPLSFTEHSREIMARVRSPKACLELAKLNTSAASSGKDSDPIGALLNKENPDCPRCNGLMSYETKKLLWCIDCGHRLKNWDGNTEFQSQTESFEDVPQCPACGMWMAKRNGPRGEFWGCSGFPDCKGK